MQLSVCMGLYIESQSCADALLPLSLQQCNSSQFSVRRPVAPGTGSPNQSKCELQSEGKRKNASIAPNAGELLSGSGSSSSSLIPIVLSPQ